MSETRLKRSLREDEIGRITRQVRDRAYDAVGRDKNDESYRSVVWALAEVRRAVRG